MARAANISGVALGTAAIVVGVWGAADLGLDMFWRGQYIYPSGRMFLLFLLLIAAGWIIIRGTLKNARDNARIAQQTNQPGFTHTQEVHTVNRTQEGHTVERSAQEVHTVGRSQTGAGNPLCSSGVRLVCCSDCVGAGVSNLTAP